MVLVPPMRLYCRRFARECFSSRQVCLFEIASVVVVCLFDGAVCFEVCEVVVISVRTGRSMIFIHPEFVLRRLVNLSFQNTQENHENQAQI